MGTEVDDLECVHRIEEAIENAYYGLPVDYHMMLGKLAVRSIGVWVPPENVEDVLNEIRNARRDVDRSMENDAQRSRYHKP